MRFKNRFKGSALSLLAALSLIPDPALAEIEYGGSIRLSDLLMHSELFEPYTGNTDDFFNVSNTSLRLIADGAFTESLSLEIHALAALSHQNQSGLDFLYSSSDADRVNRLIEATLSWDNEASWSGQTGNWS